MAATMQEVKGRIGAVRIILQEHRDEHKASYSHMSLIQASALAELLKSLATSTPEKATLAERLAEIPWASGEHAEIAMAPLAELAKPPKRRRLQQNFSAYVHYLTIGHWQQMADMEIPPDVKLQGILSHALKLGLRLPTEPSMKLLTTFWLMVTHDGQELNRMDVVTKMIRLKAAKQVFESLRRRAADPVEWIDILPNNPIEFLKQYPLTYKATFPGDAVPVSPKLDVESLQAFDMTYSCRGGQRAIPAAPRAIEPAVGSPPRSAAMERMLAAFVQTLAFNQHHMAQMMHVPQQRNQISLGMLEDRAVRLSGMHQPLALPPSGSPTFARSSTFREAEEVRESPPAKSHSLAPSSSQAPGSPGHAMAVVEDAPEEEVEEAPATEILEMVNMISDRKAEKAKGMPKAAAAPKEAKPDGKTTKAKGKSKSAKAKAKGKVLALSGPASSAPKAKAIATSSKWKPADGFGCTKRRWASKGCAQCRGKTYTGLRWNPSMP
jgi:hypothetical protein